MLLMVAVPLNKFKCDQTERVGGREREREESGEYESFWIDKNQPDHCFRAFLSLAVNSSAFVNGRTRQKHKHSYAHTRTRTHTYIHAYVQQEAETLIGCQNRLMVLQDLLM